MTTAESSGAATAVGVSASPPPSLGVRRSSSRCEHCDQAVALERFDAVAEAQFCCDGCQIVHAMLKRHALGGYYDHAAGATRPALATGRDYAEFDDPSFLSLYATKRGEEQTVELLLEGVHCAACVWLVEKLPELVPGVTECRLDYARRLAHVSFRDGGAGTTRDAGGGAAANATKTHPPPSLRPSID
jgi:copper chaperone CopZ